jgi:hypothetical protein
VAYYPGVLGLCTEMVADSDHASRLFGSSACKINSGQACCVRLRSTDARSHRAHSGSDHTEAGQAIKH